MRVGAAIVVFAALLAGCARPQSAAKPEPKEKVSYNRRELVPRPGLLTGPDGSWTIHRSGEAHAPAPPPPRVKTTLLCAPGERCDPPLSPE
jgi:hypothetical protein